ncbi:hypothetical protein [Erwinia phage Pecta]|nr:hypothetical protein [Erwinia phage Pecta]
MYVERVTIFKNRWDAIQFSINKQASPFSRGYSPIKYVPHLEHYEVRWWDLELGEKLEND